MASGLLVAEKDDYSLGLEETELRLGLPGGSENGEGVLMKSSGKRIFSEILDLKLKLHTADMKSDDGVQVNESLKKIAASVDANVDHEKPSAPKAHVVGWPPVRSFRKNMLSVNSAEKSSKQLEGDQKSNSNNSLAAASFVKVSIDGAPYLRKVDLKIYRSYQELSVALEKMFSSFTSGNCGSQGMRDFLNEEKSKPIDLLNGSEYVPTYEDKDGDWMLVGDVPWEMFVDSCKRLRIMKGSDAIGLAPRATEKCKS